MNTIQKVKSIIASKKADALLLTDKNPNHEWLLGTKIEHSIVLIKKLGKPVIIKTNLEKFDSKDYKIINVEKRKDFQKEINKLKGKKLCVDFKTTTLSQKKNFRGIKLLDVSEELSEIRMVKKNIEIAKLRKANNLTALCFNRIIKNWNKFKHENDVIKFIKEFAIQNNCWMAFDPLVASGKNAATPHHRKNTKIKKGFCVIDFGMDYKGYKADMTRTVYVGKPNKKEIGIYKELLRIQNELLTMALPGTISGDLDKAARTMLGKKAPLFTHSLGHGTGLEIHEKPNLSPDSKDKLQENMVITVEPGIYDENKYGMRIEDSILVKKGKPEILTKKAKKELIILSSPR